MSIFSFAQNADYKWAVKSSYSLLQYKGELGSQFLKFDQRNDGAGFAFSRYISPSIDLHLGIDYYRLNLSGLLSDELYYSKGSLISPSVIANYKFNNNYLLPEKAWLKPYLGAGFGYMIGKTSGASYDLKGDNFSHFIDEISLNLVAGVKLDITKKLSLFVEMNTLLATTEELDGAAIDIKNDKFSGGKIGFFFKIGGPKDQDHDGVPDDEDECPDTPLGVQVNEKGCPPDRDLDGIPDYQDDCPDDPGLPEFNGCPDRDGDGIMDKEDDCPDLPGVPEYKGCPDTDGDGVIDPKDLCPDTPAGMVVDEYGCPIDSDGDGLFDDVDHCPNEYGPMEYLGCPEPPDVGWPDTKSDVPPEVYFETDKYELTPEAEDELQKIVKFLIDNSLMNIRLFGQADPRGTDEHNKELSARRVETVKKFLIKKGIPESRILVKALGEAQEVKTLKDEENMDLDQRLRKYRKVVFDTFFFMR